MKTNQIFSLRRFINLIKSDLLINYKRYGMMILVMLLLGYVVMYLNLPKHSFGSDETYKMSRYLPFFISFSIFSLGAWIGSSFPAFNNKNTSRSYLMTPASTVEKYTAQILGRIFISTLVLLIIFWVDARFARFTVLHVIKENIPNIEKFSYGSLLQQMKLDSFAAWSIPLLILSAFGFLFSVRIYFNKHGLVKTLLSMATILFCLYLIFVIYTQIFYPEIKLFEIHANDYYISDHLKNSEILVFVIFSFTGVMLPILGFFKLKEKEL